MIGAKKDYVLNKTNIVPKKSAGPTAYQEIRPKSPAVALPNVRGTQRKRGEHPVAQGKIKKSKFSTR